VNSSHNGAILHARLQSRLFGECAMQDGTIAVSERYVAGRYRTPARLMHWLVALIVLCMIPVGITMGRINSGPLQDWLFFLHEAFGFTVFVLVLLRLAYRVTHKPPPLPLSVPRWQRVASEAVHSALYVLLLAQPFIGWFGASAYGAPVSVFGLFNLPALVAKNEPLSDRIFAVHDYVGFTIAGLLVIHIGAALMHGLIRKDGVLQRMWPP
jgi:cytochrome b561